MMQRIFKPIIYLSQFLYSKKFKPPEVSSDILYDAISDLGGIYIKLIQFICLRTEIFSDTEKMRFLSFYDRVKPESINVTRFLQEEIPSHTLKRFRSLERKPFAAGSFAQVYRAQLEDGTEVILKIKRRNIRSKLIQDFITLKILSMIIDFVFPQTYFHIPAILAEFKRLSYAELDYKQEVKNALHFRKIYRDHPTIHIPKTYPDLSTENLIVQEYVHGIPLTELIRYKHEGGDYKKWLKEKYQTDIFVFLKSIPYEMGVQMFNQDKYYADPHPGNIFILPNNRYAIIDFGILGNSPRNKRNYYNLVKTIVEKSNKMDMTSLSKEFLQFGARHFYESLSAVDYSFSKGKSSILTTVLSGYKKQLNNKREKFLSLELTGREDFSQMFIDVAQAGTKYKIQIPSELFALLRSSQLYRSYSVFLEPQWFYMRKTFEKILKNVDQRKLINRDDLYRSEAALEDSLEEVLDWVSTVAENDPPMYHSVQNMLQQNNNV